MIDETNELKQSGMLKNDPSSDSAKTSKNTVDLFPALADKRMTSINSIRQSVPQRLGTQISIFTPTSFEEALDIVECLRSRSATTISLDNLKKFDASRLVDFVAGASAALDGDFHKLSEQVYIFCPSNIKITAPDKTPGRKGTTGSVGSLDFLYPESNEKPNLWSSSTWPSS